MLLETPTARAGVLWPGRLGRQALDPKTVNCQAVRFVSLLRDFFDLAGTVGPAPASAAGEGTAEQALLNHSEQVECLAAAGVDLLFASGMRSIPEAIGLTMAAADRPILVYLALDGVWAPALRKNAQPSRGEDRCRPGGGSAAAPSMASTVPT